MRRFVYFSAITLMLGMLMVSCTAEDSSSKDSRETVLDRNVLIEKELILDIPKASRLCDEMDIWKGYVHTDDCSLYCGQEGQGTPIVLLHGGPGATHHYFHPHFSRAKDFLKIIYYDQRGCGISQYFEGDGYSIDQAVDDLEKLREALGVNKWVVLGHSYGGTLAQAYAVKYPEHLAGLVLVGSACNGLPVDVAGTRQYEFISSEERQRIGEIYKSEHLTLEQLVFNIHLNGDWKRQNFYKPSQEKLARKALYGWKHDEGLRSGINSSLGKLDFMDVFSECPIPILIMEGKWDLTWNQDKAKKLHECFPGSQLTVFENAGHNPFEDVPEKFFAELKRFVSNLEDLSEAEISTWKRYVGERNTRKEKFLNSETGFHEVVFTTTEVAPSGFDTWTFFWTAPEVDSDAIFQYIVIQPDGKVYFRYTFKVKEGQEIRSDFRKDFAGGDPKVFYNQHIIIKMLVDKGEIRFPENVQFRFEFKGTIDAVLQ
ncbi:MAG: alpha/beta fold hydrolase [Candidatus Hatepunaea meridiana]|nr:alpha/beta fold hydrolase [Candidatus Hatepunaea meridiana]